MDEKVQEQLRQLRARYAAEVPARIAALVEHWGQVSGVTWAPEAADALLRIVHGLAGSGATFGYVKLSEAARNLELALRPACEAGVALSAAAKERLAALVSLVVAAAEVGEAVGKVAMADEIDADVGEGRLVFLVEDDELLAQEVTLQLEHYGYQVQAYTALEGVEEALAEAAPVAVIMDIMFPAGGLAGAETIAALQRQRNKPLPVVFISARSDFEARLGAVRAGGMAYFPKPVEVGALVDCLDGLVERRIPEPHRVLIVEDAPVLAGYYALALRQVGMHVMTLTDPVGILEAMEDFRPELVLMDIYLPGCDGVELAKIIRQHEEYLGVSIVYLSTEASIEKQLAAMQLGADDFLTKPIAADHLVAAARARVRRARALQSRMIRDGLTNLLNHSAVSEQLDSEVLRARREHQPFVFSMIDIDHFKSVNDTHGHGVGDRVIKTLARLLQQRLRASDVVGRYGGEEFAVLLPGVETDKALEILDAIRADFAGMQHASDTGTFSVSFSFGVAGYPHYNTAPGLAEAADQALYRAKRAGRNRGESA